MERGVTERFNELHACLLAARDPLAKRAVEDEISQVLIPFLVRRRWPQRHGASGADAQAAVHSALITYFGRPGIYDGSLGTPSEFFGRMVERLLARQARSGRRRLHREIPGVVDLERLAWDGPSQEAVLVRQAELAAVRSLARAVTRRSPAERAMLEAWLAGEPIGRQAAVLGVGRLSTERLRAEVRRVQRLIVKRMSYRLFGKRGSPGRHSTP